MRRAILLTSVSGAAALSRPQTSLFASCRKVTSFEGNDAANYLASLDIPRANAKDAGDEYSSFSSYLDSLALPQPVSDPEQHVAAGYGRAAGYVPPMSGVVAKRMASMAEAAARRQTVLSSGPAWLAAAPAVVREAAAPAPNAASPPAVAPVLSASPLLNAFAAAPSAAAPSVVAEKAAPSVVEPIAAEEAPAPAPSAVAAAPASVVEAAPASAVEAAPASVVEAAPASAVETVLGDSEKKAAVEKAVRTTVGAVVGHLAQRAAAARAREAERHDEYNGASHLLGASFALAVAGGFHGPLALAATLLFANGCLRPASDAAALTRDFGHAVLALCAACWGAVARPVEDGRATRLAAKMLLFADSASTRLAALKDRVLPRVVAVDDYDGVDDGPGPGDAFFADEDVEIYSASEAYVAPSTPAAAPAAALETL